MTERQWRQNVYALLFVILGFTFADFGLSVDALTTEGALTFVSVMLVAGLFVLILPDILGGLYRHTSLLDRFVTERENQ